MEETFVLDSRAPKPATGLALVRVSEWVQGGASTGVLRCVRGALSPAMIIQRSSLFSKEPIRGERRTQHA